MSKCGERSTRNTNHDGSQPALYFKRREKETARRKVINLSYVSRLFHSLPPYVHELHTHNQYTCQARMLSLPYHHSFFFPALHIPGKMNSFLPSMRKCLQLLNLRSHSGAFARLLLSIHDAVGPVQTAPQDKGRIDCKQRFLRLCAIEL